jgi:hypothetical protein
MFRLVADARLSAEILLALRRVNRSACAASRIRDCFGCGGGGRFGDSELINQSFSNLFPDGFQGVSRRFKGFQDGSNFVLENFRRFQGVSRRFKAFPLLLLACKYKRIFNCKPCIV